MEDINTYLTILAAIVAYMALQTIYYSFKRNQLLKQLVKKLEEDLANISIEDFIEMTKGDVD